MSTNTFCWASCMVLATLNLIVGDMAAVASFVAASLVIAALEGRK